jgi:hypothetical protein
MNATREKILREIRALKVHDLFWELLYCPAAAAALQLQVFVVVVGTWHCCKVLYAITKTIISISLAAVSGSKLCKLSHAVRQSESTYIFFFVVFTIPTSIQILASSIQNCEHY